MALVIVVFGCVVAGVFWWYQLWQVQERLEAPIVTFGDKKTMLTMEERKAIVSAHLRQQSWAFALVWFAVALGIVLGGYLVGRLFFSGTFGRIELEAMIGLAGDVSLAGGAFRLYKTSAKRLQDILELALSSTATA